MRRIILGTAILIAAVAAASAQVKTGQTTSQSSGPFSSDWARPYPQTGGYCLTADDAAGLVVRPRSALDDATPNANGTMAENLVRLAALTGCVRLYFIAIKYYRIAITSRIQPCRPSFAST